jgi:uncharacterized RDD family membrane protein YckC
MEEHNIEIALQDASRGARLGSALIDMLLLLVIILPLALFLGVFENLGDTPPPLGTTILMAVISLGLYFAMNGKLLYENAQTIGKKFNGIKIVNLDGSKPSIQDLIVKRYIPYFGFPYIPYIGGIVNLVNLCFIFGKERRCLHDKIAGTKVVKS